MESKTILIAEDDGIMRTALKHKFEQLGYSVMVAADGEEGLKAFVDHGADALIVDIMMPKMDGATMLEEIRLLPEGKNVPAVVLTNADDLGYVARTTNSDAEAYVLKSDQSLDEVVALIEKRIGSIPAA